MAEDSVLKLKSKRKILRTTVSKILKKLETELGKEDISTSIIEENLDQLIMKSKSLTDLDAQIQHDLKVETDEFETEITSCIEYEEKIQLWQFRANKKLKELTKMTNSDNENSIFNETAKDSQNESNKFTRLPKLTISKFYGYYTRWTSFWNSFKVAIHDNESLTKIEKFNYLKSYLCGNAAHTIEGFCISEQNYDEAVEILKNRFGRKDIIINSHMQKLLNLTPVTKTSDILKLRKLCDTIETEIRSLKSLEVTPDKYSYMLIPAIMKTLPSEITLEFNRKTDSSSFFNVDKLIQFIRSELECRERNHLLLSTHKSENTSCAYKEKKGGKESITSSAYQLLAPVSENKTTNWCLFCNTSKHVTEKCESLTVDEKRNLLRKQGRCFLCLKSKHRMKECKSGVVCSRCKGKHNRSICFQAEKELKEKNDSVQDSHVLSTFSGNKIKTISLQTCCVTLRTNTQSVLIRALLDSGSMRSFVAKEIADKLKLPIIRSETLSVFTFGNKTPIRKTFNVVKIKLENKEISNSKIKIEVLVTEQISSSDLPPPNVNKHIIGKQLERLQLADSWDCKEKITLLIGADYYYDIVTGKLKRLDKHLVAAETLFGWSLLGYTKGTRCTSTAFNIVVEEDIISDQIKNFWELESLGIKPENESSDPLEDAIMEKFESEILYKNSRYKVRLPWKSDRKYELHNNKAVAVKRFEKLIKRFQNNPELFYSYQTVLQDYLQQNIIEPVPDTELKSQCETQITFYLPHREIIRSDRTTSKLRIVFDASSHEPGEISLNDCLYIGPNLYPDIFELLLAFRLHPVAFISDIKQAFLQIEVDEKDRDVTRFLFTENPFEDPQNFITYRFTRVLFGVNSSPFLLAATIKHHLKQYKKTYPATCEFLNDHIYVDDIIGGHQNVELAFNTSLECISIFRDASMILHKWHTNSQELRELWIKEGIECEESPQISEARNPPLKVLGVAWDNQNDSIYFDVKNLITFLSKQVNTKRFVLQAIGRIFDPVGLLSPFVLRIKIILQQIWVLALDWDDELPENLCSVWKKWCKEVSSLDEIGIPRYYFSAIGNSDVERIELHCFSDASKKAYGTVAYLRIISSNEQIFTVFVASKTRVAPLKPLTLPRLELMGALLSAKLGTSIVKVLKLQLSCFFWTDSKVTLFWIKDCAKKFKLFVKNRIQEIQNLTSPENWHYCPGKSNPADLASRGAKLHELKNNPIWFQGPEWLRMSSELWPRQNEEKPIVEEELEYRKNINDIYEFVCTAVEERLIDISKYSNLRKLLRITSWMKRFIGKIRKTNHLTGSLTTEELVDAENYWIRSEQERFYPKEIESLKKANKVEKKSSLYLFDPFLDQNGILRAGGRLEHSSLSHDEKHPAILSRNSWLTNLIVESTHVKMMHGGVATTLAEIRSRFWIPKGRQFVKKVINKCLICKKYSLKSADQTTSQLPEDRINETPPFYVCGVDFAGPIYVKNVEGNQKAYVALFTCATTRAIHLELVPNLSTDSFLMAFKRFTSRRGNCRVIYSDNAKTFKKGKKELENFSKLLSNEKFQDFLSNEKIEWKFIIDRGAWWGGFYERLVKSVKECARKILGKALLTSEELSTVLAQVEAVLNSRPLTYVYSDHKEPLPLKPVNFLIFEKKDSTLPITFKSIVKDGSTKNLDEQVRNSVKEEFDGFYERCITYLDLWENSFGNAEQFFWVSLTKTNSVNWENAETSAEMINSSFLDVPDMQISTDQLFDELMLAKYLQSNWEQWKQEETTRDVTTSSEKNDSGCLITSGRNT
ncbi:hypothetical protein X975_06179, partial [Stegodyphus mimosarum]